MILSGRDSARKITRARILLKADQNEEGPAWFDVQISQALDVGVATIEWVRKRFVEEGLEAALNRRKNSNLTLRRKLDGHQEARLVMLACGKPPEGHACWSLRLLADQMVELEIVDSISYQTVNRVLKKTVSSRG
ncbi:MAG: helix-turn-helix domain-containing protein [Candidatus Hodarchaeales archaeon]